MNNDNALPRWIEQIWVAVRNNPVLSKNIFVIVALTLLGVSVIAFLFWQTGFLQYLVELAS